MLWAIAAGSAVGGVLRYLLGGWVQRLGRGDFPVGTLAVNVAGALLLGVLAGLGQRTDLAPEVRAGLTVGLCGGFTTFSTFAFESWTLLGQGEWRRAALYGTVSVILSIGAIAAGIAAGRRLVA